MSTVLTRGNTPWMRSIAAQLTQTIRTQMRSSTVLVAAIILAMLWAGLSFDSWDDFWSTPVVVGIGTAQLQGSLREWISSGLMSLFFLVVGAEARHEIDLGALRERRQFVLPAVAGVFAMALPILIYLAVNAQGGRPNAWGVAMSTDTALAIGLLAVVSRSTPKRVTGFLLTLFIVDDLISLLVIATVYSEHFQITPFLAGVGLLLLSLLARQRTVTNVAVAPLAIASWGAVFVSGVDPLIVGLAFGLTARAYVPGRDGLTGAFESFRQFREQPTFRSAKIATAGLQEALSQNERLQARYRPVASYVIVPLFAFANAGVPLNPEIFREAFASPIFLGIVIAYGVGKPLAVTLATWLSSRVSRRSLQPPVGWASVAATGTIAGVGFTVSILVASIVFTGQDLSVAKLAIIATAVLAAAETWLVYRATALLPRNRRERALLGRPEDIEDLMAPVNPDRDHIRGSSESLVTLVEYGDFECPFCGRAEPEVRAVLGDQDVRVVWRHLPIAEIHPHAMLAAEVSEAAADQNAFWEMHDLLLSHQDALTLDDVRGYAAELQLDVERLVDAVERRSFAERVLEDVRTGDASGVAGTPTFFINGERHYGPFDAASLRAAVLAAQQRTALRSSN